MSKYALLGRFSKTDRVRHRLYPELGTGEVTWVTPLSSPTSKPVATVQWPTGQVSTHAMSVLLGES